MSEIATAIFCFRNYGKVGRGDYGRLPAAFAQTVNSAGQVVNKIADKVGNLEQYADTGKILGERAARVSQLASKVTNPLLVGAAAIRVAKDDDKKSALIEETAAMGGMFAAERLYKIVRNTVKEGKGDILQANESEILSKIPVLKQLDKITTRLDTVTFKNTWVGSKLASLGEQIGKLSSGKQKALFIAAELGLVATSILSYSLFKKIGKNITGRNKQKETKKAEEIPKTKEIAEASPAFTNLTTKKT